MKDRIASYMKTKQIIQKYNFFLKKGFGQNFLIDTSILDSIVEAADINKQDCVLEIGPGIGSLTQVLCESANKVIAVEIDTKLTNILNDTLSDYNNIEILNNDILKLDILDIIYEKNDNKPIKVVANLPYYITTPIIMELLEKKLPIESITVMVQKEVAERMQAIPSTKDYGTLSLAVQYYSNPQIIMNVSSDCFIPKPNVDSSIIHLKLLKEPSVNVKSQEFLFKIIKIGFSQRRKTLINCLNNSNDIKLSKENIAKAINEIGLDEKIRGEALSLKQFALLSDILY